MRRTGPRYHDNSDESDNEYDEYDDGYEDENENEDPEAAFGASRAVTNEEVDDAAIEATHHQDQQREAEKRLYWRFGQFLFLMGIFWSIIFFAEIEHDNTLLILGMIGFGLWLVYMLVTIVISVCTLSSSRHDRLDNILTQEELQDVYYDDDDEDEGEGDQRLWNWSMKETPHRIRTCYEEIGATLAQNGPTNGLYKIVYTATYFGKNIRSESQMQFTFVLDTKNNNGWDVNGTTVSAIQNAAPQTTRAISEGFINARGEMYWIIDDSNNRRDNGTSAKGIYRGNFDFKTNSLVDGEFQAGDAPRGRIVSMELIKNMTASTTFNTSSNGHNKQQLLPTGGAAMNVEMVQMNKRGVT